MQTSMIGQLLILISMFLTATVIGQGYDSLIRSANTLFEAKEYCKSSAAYSAAFSAMGGKGYAPDRYQAAKAWVSCDNNDSAFFQLFKLADKTKFLELQLLMTDEFFKKLHIDSRWTNLLHIINPNNEVYNDSLSKILIAIREKDQQHRLKLDVVRRPYGTEPSDEFNALLKIGVYNDSVNLISVTSIIDKYGWLSVNEVGSKANSTLWLVIQHADKDVMIQEKYLRIMREAVNNGKALKRELAYLEDRVLKNQGKNQIYGTQSYLNENTNKLELWPINDPMNLNKRREAMGLQPM